MLPASSRPQQLLRLQLVVIVLLLQLAACSSSSSGAEQQRLRLLRAQPDEQWAYWNISRAPLHAMVILPARTVERDMLQLTHANTRPIVEKALQEVFNKSIVPVDAVRFSFYDSHDWDAPGDVEMNGMLGMIQGYCDQKLDMVLGFADVYGLATATKVSAGFTGGRGVPILTTIATPSTMRSRKSFPLLTRMQGSYRQMSEAIYSIFVRAEWTQYMSMLFMYHDKKRAINKPKAADDDVNESEVQSSYCYHALIAIKAEFTSNRPEFKELWKMDTPHLGFDEQLERTAEELEQWLKEISMKTNVVILCASPDTVREIMLSAFQLGMTSGKYVFINIDVSTGSHAERPWMRTNSTVEENENAKTAYRALKTISLRRSAHRDFDRRVTKRAEEKYKYKLTTGKDYEMNNFISAFYDAVLLYAIALNDTVSAGGNPRDGHLITQKMWNRTFEGIAGNVSIDANGDRYSDYSLLDLDPEQGKFTEVAYYRGIDKKLQMVGKFHWIGDSPPQDTPICGWDESLCPKGFPMHVYLLIGAAIIILVLGLLFIFFWRRYKLEQELAAKSWMISWEELDGEERTKNNGKKKSKSSRKKNGDGIAEGDPLLRSGSRTTLTSDKFADEEEGRVGAMRTRLRSSSSGATRKISAMIDRKFSLFTRKKSSPNTSSSMEKGNGGPSFNHIGELKETSLQDGEASPTGNEVSFQVPFGSAPGEGAERRRKVSISSPQLSSSPDYTNKKSSTEEDVEFTSKRNFMGMRKKSGRKLSFGEVSSIRPHGGGSIETLAMAQGGQVYTKTACYKGTIVAIKRLSLDLKKYPKLELTRQHLMDFKKMKDLQHDHITRFTGACVDAPNYCIVTEYCSKGSLEDILENEKIELDNMMKYSLLHDLVKGMYFIHNSEIRAHGKLKSSNCVVDSRFVLKVTDFGLSTLHMMEDLTIESKGEFAYYKRLLWTAPELLRDPNVPNHAASQKGDIYSFAVILHEMMYRKGAFWTEEENPSPRQIIEKVKQIPKNARNPEEAFRPFCPANDGLMDTQIVDMMRLCWSEEPSVRPDFAAIRKAVRGVNKENETSNLVDNLLKRMEQYAGNLETVVEERTREYLAEKKKVEELLHQLLPRAIADTLIAGKAVQAEHYDCVTIYFSDIVGFTALSSMSTPMQVVTLLNDLYLAFDGVVDNFKVYKVETIGDAYMVVSGLPERTEDHASQIAQMSIALLHKVKNFVIRHRPTDQLKLRIGMHSGSVVAGVVGSKMPRYCLFGDTVNTSSRMESNGLPLRIHVSMRTKEILSHDTGFRLDLRGEVEMKGKGKQTTYWLKGYKDTDIPDFGPEFRH